jgi:hypothetical protein
MTVFKIYVGTDSSCHIPQTDSSALCPKERPLGVLLYCIFLGDSMGDLALRETAGETWRKLALVSGIPVWKSENTAVGILHADHLAPSIRKSGH